MSEDNARYASLLRRTREFLRRGDLAEADRLIHRALALEPERAGALHLLGVLHEMRGEEREAQKAYRAALSFESYPPSSHNLERLVLHGGKGKLLLAEDEALRPGDASPSGPETEGEP